MRDHRSLEAWQQAHALAKLGIRMARAHWQPFAAEAFSQLQRSTLSVQLNIAEGYARFTRPQFAQSLTIAYGSAVEAGEILELLVEEGVIDTASGQAGILIANRCQRLLIGLIKHVRRAKPNPA